MATVTKIYFSSNSQNFFVLKMEVAEFIQQVYDKLFYKIYAKFFSEIYSFANFMQNMHVALFSEKKSSKAMRQIEPHLYVMGIG